jgi:hypothetical protein
MNAQELLALKDTIRKLVHKRPGYRSIGVVRDDTGPQVLIDVDPKADLNNYKDILGTRGGVSVQVRRVSGKIRAEHLHAE